MKHVAILAILFAASFILVREKIAHAPFGYDEADYMFAATLGLERNWLDTGAMSFPHFVRLGLKRGGDSTSRNELSALARGSNDPNAYRHWHGPLYYFWLASISHANLDEASMRVLSLVFPVLTTLVIYFSSLLLLGGYEGQIAAILSSALFMWSPVTLMTTELAPHMLFVLCCVCAMLLLAKVAVGDGRRPYYAAVVCAALAFCTLEVAFVLVLVLAICAYWKRDKLAVDWRFARNSIGLFLGTILLVWPVGLLKLNFLKAYVVMAYLAVFRKGAWGNVGFLDTWALRFRISPVEWILIAIAFVLCFRKRTGLARRGAVVFLLFAGLMILSMLKVYAEGPRYMTVFFPALELFSGWVLAAELAPRPNWLRYAALSAICGLLFWNSHHKLAPYLLREDPRPAAVLALLHERGLEQKALLVPQVELPMLHYYFPHAQIRGYLDVSAIPRERSLAQIDAVLYPGYPVIIDSITPAP